jgi:hypothetical protein
VSASRTAYFRRSVLCGQYVNRGASKCKRDRTLPWYRQLAKSETALIAHAGSTEHVVVSMWPLGAKSLTCTPSAYNLADAGFPKSAQIITSQPVSFRFYPYEFPRDLDCT